MRARALPLGGRQSVGRIGSHTTSTRSLCPGNRAISCSAAEAPRRHVGQVGESSNTRRGPLESASKDSSNSFKFAAARVNSGRCPCGTEDGPHKYAPASSSNVATIPEMIAFLFIFPNRLTGLQEIQRSAGETKSFPGRQSLPPKAALFPQLFL